MKGEVGFWVEGLEPGVVIRMGSRAKDTVGVLRPAQSTGVS